jgi:hypothetical protein
MTTMMSPTGVVVAPNLLDLAAQHLLETTVVSQASELVGDRLALNLLVQLDVLQGQRSLPSQRCEQIEIRSREGPSPTTDGEHTPGIPSWLPHRGGGHEHPL